MPDDATLFVIFHGSWCLLETPDYFYIKTPDMGSEHAYRSGNWLGERNLPQGSYYRLTDNIATDKSCCLDRTINPLIKNSSLAGTSERGSHTTFLFAKPLKVHSVGQLTLTTGTLKRNRGELVNQDPSCQPGDPQPDCDLTASLIHIFEYTYNTAIPPVIDGMSWWTPIAIPDYAGRGKAATLHLFAEHEVNDFKGTSHVSQAFRFGSLILGADFELTSLAGVKPASTQQSLPDLLVPRCFELESLGNRSDRMTNLGMLRATLDAGQEPTEDLLTAWESPQAGCLDPLLGRFRANSDPDAPSATCLPGGGQGGCP